MVTVRGAESSVILARDGTVLAPGDSSHPVVVDAVPIRRAPTDIRGLVTSSLGAMIAQAHAADVTLDTSVDDRVPPLVNIDADKIGWALSALVGNALRYVRHGSNVMPGGAITVRITYQEIRPSIVIDVQDDGPGIPADKLRALFEATPDRPRVALGLLIVRDFVIAHAGQLDVRGDTGTAGRGTAIRITLPVS
ncbi:MAG TPA: ATP-binding protein [Vicinamibacterales bacterium]|nr:ATP-binding protein [Vicinamibacterales bacterium]